MFCNLNATIQAILPCALTRYQQLAMVSLSSKCRVLDQLNRKIKIVRF